MSRWTIHSTYTQRTITQLREAILPHMTTWTALKDICCCCSVAKWCPTLWPHGLEHTRLPCPSLSPGVCSDSYPLSQWCHLTILSSVIPFSSCLQSFSASGSFPMSRVFASGGQSMGASVLASVLPVNIHHWFPLGLTGYIFYFVQGSLRNLLQYHTLKASVLWCSAILWSNSHIHTWLLGKP